MDIDCSIGRISKRTVAASGTRLPYTDQQVIRLLTENGTWATWTFQVVGINKPLDSVSKLIDDGWRVVFDDEASYIDHRKAGCTIELTRERVVFVIDAIVDPSHCKSDFSQRDADKRRNP